MTTQVVHRELGPKQVRQLNEIYERARAVKAQYPESHVASKAAKKLIDAFEAVTPSGETALDRVWLGDATPKGTA